MRLPIRIATVLLALLLGVCANGQKPPGLTGHWRQQTASGTQRGLDIEQNGAILRVKTTITNSKGSRHLEVTYQIGGPETVYKGLDGDEFHTSVHWDGNVLVFETIEHEGGKEIPQTTVWALSESGNNLQVKRRSAKSAGKGESSSTYVRQP